MKLLCKACVRLLCEAYMGSIVGVPWGSCHGVCAMG